jgi:hypothetical protein
MMTLTNRKYVGWSLNSISLDNDVLAIGVIRASRLQSEDLIPPDIEGVRETILFASVRKIVLSDVHGGSEIKDIRLGTDENGRVKCILDFFCQSFIEVTVQALPDLPS